MEEYGLWKLFFLTGLPEAWLALRGLRLEQDEPEEPALTAFAGAEEDGKEI